MKNEACLERGYEESVITEQTDKTRKQDRVTLLDKANGKHDNNQFYADNIESLSIHSMLKLSEKHRKVIPQPSLISFKQCNNLKDLLVRAKLYNEEAGTRHNRGCTRYVKCVMLCETLILLLPI